MPATVPSPQPPLPFLPLPSSRAAVGSPVSLPIAFRPIGLRPVGLLLLPLLLLAGPPPSLGAQQTGVGAGGAQQPAPPPADPADVASEDAIIAAVYDVISGAAGEERDWDRFRSLFIPEARLIPAGRDPDTGEAGYRAWSPEEYIESAGPFLVQNGFFENEIGRTSERYGHIVHAFSAYESRRTPGEDPFARGINSFQLLDTGERWWIVTIFWQGETEDNPIPERYLGRR